VKGTTTTLFKGYAYAWLTLAFFLGLLILHWWFGWRAFLEEAAEHGQSAAFGPYAIQNAARHVRELAIGVSAASVATLPWIPQQPREWRSAGGEGRCPHFQGDKGKEIIVQLHNHFMRHPCEPRPTVERTSSTSCSTTKGPRLS